MPYAEANVDALYALELALSADEPGEVEPRRLSFDEWRADMLEGPEMTQEGSFAVLADEHPSPTPRSRPTRPPAADGTREPPPRRAIAGAAS